MPRSPQYLLVLIASFAFFTCSFHVVSTVSASSDILISAETTQSATIEDTEKAEPKEEESKPQKEAAEDTAEEQEKSTDEAKDKAPQEEEQEEDSPEAEDSETDDDEEEDSDKPKPFQVKKKALKIEVELDGNFIADNMEEVELRPEVWTKFKVLEAVKHGSLVKKGDILVRFDPEDLEKDIAKQSIDQRLAELSFLQAEENYDRAKRLAEIDFENAKRRYEESKEDYEYYKTTDRPFYVEIAEYRFKSSQEQLASAREELEQLQQMYEADEITEATEEIVLRRQKFAVETAELVMRLSTEDRNYTMNVVLPRRDEYYRTSMEENELRFKQATTAFDTGLNRQVYEMEKRRQSHARSVERHAKLIGDKRLMTIRAPTDGVVYYGRCQDGKWSEVSSMKNKLKPNGSASAKSVLMTIVKPRPLHVKSSFAEKVLPDIKKGLKTIISPAADDKLEFTGKVTEFESIPGKSNKFSILFEIGNSELPDWLVAGMTCKAKVETYNNPEALQIPKEMVQTDEENEKTKYVMLLTGDEGEPVRRIVKLGREKDKMVEVLEGLKEDDEIVKEEKNEES